MVLDFFFFLQAHYSPQNFTNNLGKALEILHAEVWRLGHMASEQLNHSPPPWPQTAWR